MSVASTSALPVPYRILAARQGRSRVSPEHVASMLDWLRIVAGEIL
jgi:hypothetical protein